MSFDDLDLTALADLCRAHHVRRIEVFGSVAAGRDREGSDVDQLVTFAPEAPKSYLAPDGVVALHQALERLLGRRIDLLDRQVVERDPNVRFRESVLASAETLYAA